MKRLAALYKCYRGGEWFGASLESVRRHVAGVVAVLSDKPWRRSGDGPERPENCREPLEEFRRAHPECPVAAVHLNGRHDTEDQYRAGLAAVAAAFGPDCGVLIVDTDEVWEDSDLTALRKAMSEDRRAVYFRSGIWTYLRSPLCRVHPQELARPVVGLACPGVKTGHSRFSDLPRLAGRGQIRDVPGCSMHHFGYVRLDEGEIVCKLSNTSAQDRTPQRRDWKREVWDRLPAGVNLHPTPGCERCWPRAVEVSAGAVPEAVLASPTFWVTLGRAPADVLLTDDPGWRASAEKDAAGVVTTVPDGAPLPLPGDAGFLTPRLRMSVRETLQLAEHARAVPEGGTVLEIGSGLGGSLAVLGLCAQAARLFAVDPYQPYDEQNVTLSRGVAVGTAEEFWKTMRHLRLEPCLLRESSAAARAGWCSGEVDLLLVDGNHSYEHALHDLAAWWPLLRPGGTLLLHDLSGRFPGVVRAAREFEAAQGVRFSLPLRSTLAWLRKGGA